MCFLFEGSNDGCVQEEHDELEEQYLKEKAELEAKYNAKYAPLYEKVSVSTCGTWFRSWSRSSSQHLFQDAFVLVDNTPAQGFSGE